MLRITLDLKERLFLFNQYQILKVLYPKDASYYTHVCEIVKQGYELDYALIFQNINDEPMSTQECEEVVGILTMFLRLEQSYRELEDKSGIEPYRVTFRGFGGNEEYRYIGYTRYLIANGIFRELKNARSDLNSHIPVIGIYRLMLNEWEPLRYKNPLPKSDIQKIIAAAYHPTE